MYQSRDWPKDLLIHTPGRDTGPLSTRLPGQWEICKLRIWSVLVGLRNVGGGVYRPTRTSPWTSRPHPHVSIGLAGGKVGVVVGIVGGVVGRCRWLL